MSTQDRLDLIRRRLNDAFLPSQLNVIDESDQHVGHAGHQGGGRHFAIQIAASCFVNISKVDAHRQIYALFSDMMPDPIHALRIQVL